jgi:hypothetical protein
MVRKSCWGCNNTTRASSRSEVGRWVSLGVRWLSREALIDFFDSTNIMRVIIVQTPKGPGAVVKVSAM